MTPAEFDAKYEKLLPAEVSGADFLAKFQKTAYKVTTVQPDLTYPVRQASRHPVYENARVQQFIALLQAGDEAAMSAAGELMYAAHESYSACGLGSAQTDLLVDLVRQLGPKQGLYGAKITGGGSGGTVAVLARKGTDALVREITTEYRQRTGIAPKVLKGSAQGAVAWGIREI